MEKFTTFLNENYKLEKSIRTLISKYVNDEKEIKTIECNGDEVKIEFKPNFGSNMKKTFEALKKISDLAKNYPILGTTRTDKDNFNMILKKKS